MDWHREGVGCEPVLVTWNSSTKAYDEALLCLPSPWQGFQEGTHHLKSLNIKDGEKGLLRKHQKNKNKTKNIQNGWIIAIVPITTSMKRKWWRLTVKVWYSRWEKDCAIGSTLESRGLRRRGNWCVAREATHPSLHCSHGCSSALYHFYFQKQKINY